MERKSLFSLAVSILIILVVAVWAYQLYAEFRDLRPAGVAMQFLTYLAKLFLFVLFLVIAILFLALARPAMNRAGNFAFGAELEPIQREIGELKRMLLRGSAGAHEIELSPAPELVRTEKALLTALHEIARAESLDACWKAALFFLREITGAGRVSLQLCQPSSGPLKTVFAVGFDPLSPVPQADRPSEMVRKTGRRLFVTSIETHPELSRPNRPQYGRGSFIILPVLLTTGAVAGTFCITEKALDGGIFSQSDLDHAEMLESALAARLSPSPAPPF